VRSGPGRPTAGAATGDASAFAVFRPRRGRAVAAGLGLVSLALFTASALFLPGPGQGGQWRAGDRLSFVSFGVAVAALLWRYATIRAVPTRQSLTVRNLLTTRTVPWARVAAVRFGGGDPWVTLELDDTEVLAVMAVQKADGAFGRAEAARLAALVAGLSGPGTGQGAGARPAPPGPS
jgi:hypothetical protein